VISSKLGEPIKNLRNYRRKVAEKIFTNKHYEIKHYEIKHLNT